MPAADGIPALKLEALAPEARFKAALAKATVSPGTDATRQRSQLRKRVAEARERGDLVAENFALRSLSDYLRDSSSQDGLPEIAARFRELHVLLDSPVPLVNALMAEAFVARLNQDTVTAIEKTQQRIQVLENAGESALAGTANLSLGKAIFDLGDYELAISIYETAARELEQGNLKSSVNYASATLSIGYSLLELERYEEAMAIFDEVTQLEESNDSTVLASYIDTARAKTLYGMGQPDAAFRVADRVLERGLDFLPAPVYAEFSVWKAARLLDANRIVEAEQALKFGATAIDLDSGETIETKLDGVDPFYAVNYARNMAIVMDRLGRPSEALRYARYALSNYADWMQAEKLQATVNVETLMQIRSRDEAIAGLERDRLLQAARLDRAQLRQNSAILGALAVAIIAVLIFVAYRNQKRAATLQTLIVSEEQHRTKNALQLAASLIRAEARQRNQGADALSASEPSEVAQRIKVMSMVYDRLHRSTEGANVDARPFLTDLSREVLSAFRSGGPIGLELDVEDRQLHASVVTPIGLIVCEALMNVCKHAFGSKEPGSVAVTLRTEGRQRVLLISDDGDGPPDPDKISGGGTQLIHDLADQLGAQAQMLDDCGTTWRIAPIPDRLRGA
ncbi:sensor histidine kinase [Erythrobacter ani]|uniref:histidine kinase n=1 Tax=Erythrobacter ani TaxID=2827235 RepID=A0ABS6SLT6_9SPHN|nr:histidine kinase dimerization/phosphoacceptor domain -containing protein [Erythrobacter ani]MBV7265991.1 ATP-binding protein [Erythrobacter ani]